jgi:sulfatase maturation enzyme AslB (radical SAM superfamily)
MPTVNVNVDVNVNEYVEVNVEEVLGDCSDEEMAQVIQYLKYNEFINDNESESKTFPHQQFHDSMLTIVDNYYLLTPEEQSIVEAIANKYK